MKKIKFASMLIALSMMVSWTLTVNASALTDPQIQAKAALLVDADSGRVLYSLNEHDKMYPASLTKIMTALIVFEKIESGDLSPDQTLTASSSALAGLSEDGSTAGIKVGEQMTVKNLMYCMLVASANEACNILAEAAAGDISTFVGLMNQTAHDLGCTGTNFVNTNGLHDDNHYTTAYDMYLITREAMKYPLFNEICDTTAVDIPATNISEERHLLTTNYLISHNKIPGYVYQYAKGIKTGHTTPAGHCLVSTAEKSSETLISVVMGADTVTQSGGSTTILSFTETSRLFDWGFENFSNQTIAEATEPIQEVPVRASSDADYVIVRPETDLVALLPSDTDISSFERQITINDENGIVAPIAEGQVLGQMTVSSNGEVIGTVNLVASSSLSRSQPLYIVYKVETAFDNIWFRIIFIAAAIAIVVLILLRFRGGGRRTKSGRRRPRGGGYSGSRRRRR